MPKRECECAPAHGLCVRMPVCACRSMLMSSVVYDFVGGVSDMSIAESKPVRIYLKSREGESRGLATRIGVILLNRK